MKRKGKGQLKQPTLYLKKQRSRFRIPENHQSFANVTHRALSALPSPKQLALTVCGLGDIHQAFTNKRLQPNHCIARGQSCLQCLLPPRWEKKMLKHWETDSSSLKPRSIFLFGCEYVFFVCFFKKKKKFCSTHERMSNYFF